MKVGERDIDMDAALVRMLRREGVGGAGVLFEGLESLPIFPK
jgi:hypothetical protein